MDEEEKALLDQLKGFDVDGDGEIGLAELCSLGNQVQREKQNSANLMKIVWGVILLAVLLVVISFVSAFAANEASKDTKPSSSGALETIGGKVVSTGALAQESPIMNLALLTPTALDGMTRLRFSVDSVTYSYTVTGYALDTISQSQRTVRFYTARGDVILVTQDAGQGTAQVKTTDGSTLDIGSATTEMSGRRLLQSGDDGSSATSSTGQDDTVVLTASNGCSYPSDTEFSSASADPGQGDYKICSYDGDLDRVCCYTADYEDFAIADCAGSDTRCSITAVAGEDLSDIIAGVIAPDEGYVSIYAVASDGSASLMSTVMTTSDPRKCYPRQYGYLCVYGEADDGSGDEATPTPAPTSAPSTVPTVTADGFAVGSMEDCEDFIGRFSTTGEFDDDGECAGLDDATLVLNRGTSVLTRYFCMECIAMETYHTEMQEDPCTDTSAVPYEVVLHIYTNSLPNHHMNNNVGSVTNDDLPDAKEVYLPFKPALVESLETGTNAVESQDDLDSILCDHGWVGSNYMSAKSSATNDIGLDTDCDGVMDGKYDGVSTWSAIGLDGVELASGLSSNDLDPHYPPGADGTYDSAEVETIDGSLGHFSGSTLYHYHIAATIYADLTVDTEDLAGASCNEIDECFTPTSVSTSPDFTGTNNIAYYMMHGTGSGGYMNPNNPLITDQVDDELGPVIGIALDGRPIRGPAIYSSATATWDQVYGLDICNGRLPSAATDTRQYSYYATTHHPYINGCFGPGPGYSTTVDFVQTCTWNPPSKYPTTSVDVLEIL